MLINNELRMGAITAMTVHIDILRAEVGRTIAER